MRPGLAGVAGWVVAVGVLLAGCTGGVRSGGGPDAAPVYVGSRWTLAAVDEQGEHVAVPRGTDAWVEFARNGRVSMKDSVNYSSGDYTATGSGFVASEVAGTTIGVADPTPLQSLVIRAMDQVLRLPTSSRMAGDDLVLGAGPYRLGFHRIGRTVIGRVLVSDAEPGSSMQALVSGMLSVNPAGCLMLDGRVVVVPHGTTLNTDHVSIRTPKGVVLRLGDRVSGGGGFAEFTTEQVPSHYQGCGVTTFVFANDLNTTST